MNKITGKKVDHLPYPGLHKVVDLTYYDGPLLSLFRDTANRGCFYYWCDADDTSNRWLVVQITEEQLARYIKQTLSLDEILIHPVGGELYVVDIDSQGKHNSVLLTHPEQLPVDYFPQKHTFFDPTTTIFYEQNTITDVISLLLDEVHTLRQAKPEYSQYNQRQLSALPV